MTALLFGDIRRTASMDTIYFVCNTEAENVTQGQLYATYLNTNITVAVGNPFMLSNVSTTFSIGGAVVDRHLYGLGEVYPEIGPPYFILTSVDLGNGTATVTHLDVSSINATDLSGLFADSSGLLYSVATVGTDNWRIVGINPSNGAFKPLGSLWKVNPYAGFGG